MMNKEQFKHWLYELDEQELCNSRDKIMEFVEKGGDKFSPPLQPSSQENGLVLAIIKKIRNIK